MVDTLFTFLVLKEMLSVFSQSVQCWLYVCHIHPSLCWGKSLLVLVYFIAFIMRNFVVFKGFFWIFGGDYMVLEHDSVYMLLSLSICMYWTVIVFIEWSKFDHNLWSFKYVVEFIWQTFYLACLHLCPSNKLAYCFHLFLWSYLVWVIVASKNAFVSAALFFALWNNLIRATISSSVKAW
jgi:hypothetical protein